MSDRMPEPAEAAPDRGARRSRRASRPAPEGVDPRPSSHPLGDRAAEDRPESWGDGARGGSAAKRVRDGGSKPGENDERLRRDRPPHWG
ncbi:MULTISPECIES: hypothetical protein [unclassified Leucobacter]|uniref:hypothetical protein n=1 Tax=unclassified Leucobacter TaxID=2621730 RepID=UPI0006228F7C|nr:hypothetical protein [Leucobacter sp. Ag1]KKI22312.1 hypothetical protein XM48_02145 [Leucobacter sp. Ag1]